MTEDAARERRIWGIAAWGAALLGGVFVGWVVGALTGAAWLGWLAALAAFVAGGRRFERFLTGPRYSPTAPLRKPDAGGGWLETEAGQRWRAWGRRGRRGDAATSVPSAPATIAERPRAEKAEPAPAPGAEPAGARPVPVEDERPPALNAPRGGTADDLKRLRGVGPKLEAQLNRLGYYHLDQLAAWTPAQVAWVDRQPGVNGRASRGDWVGQAAALRTSASGAR